MPTVECPQMTVGDAEDLVRLHGIDAMGETWLDIAKLFRSHGVRAAVPVHNHVVSLAATTACLRHAGPTLDLLTGSDRLVHVLRDEFRRALETCTRLQGSARIMVVNNAATGFEELQREFPEVLRVCRAHSRTPENASHYLATGHGMCRVEDPHPRLHIHSSADAVRSKLFVDDDAKASQYHQIMDRDWTRVTGERKPEPPKRRYWRFWKPGD